MPANIEIAPMTMKEAWTQTQSQPTCTNCQKLENDKRLLRNELIAIKEKLKLHLSEQGNNVCISLIYGVGAFLGGIS
jgi:hypothetical protein